MDYHMTAWATHYPVLSAEWNRKLEVRAENWIPGSTMLEESRLSSSPQLCLGPIFVFLATRVRFGSSGNSTSLGTRETSHRKGLNQLLIPKMKRTLRSFCTGLPLQGMADSSFQLWRQFMNCWVDRGFNCSCVGIQKLASIVGSVCMYIQSFLLPELPSLKKLGKKN